MARSPDDPISLSRLPRLQEFHNLLRIEASRFLELRGGIEQVAFAVQNRERGHSLFERDVVLLGQVKVLVVLADIDMHHTIILVDQRLDVGLMEAIVEGETIEAPVSAEDQ